MDARQLEYVVAIADEHSFTRAAERCHIAQSALSHQVARLEAELGVKVFERTSRSVRLSEAGRTLLPFARRVLDDMTDARDALDALAGLTRGRLRIGMTQTAGRALDLIAVIGDFHRRHPDIELSTQTGPGSELIDAVRERQIDLAFAALAPATTQDGVTFRTLIYAAPLVAVVGHDHDMASRKRVKLQELADTGGFVEFRTGTTLRQLVDAAFAAAGIRRTSNLEVGQITDMLRYAAHGMGAAIVPQAFTQPDPGGSDPPAGLHVLRLAHPDLRLRIGAFHRQGETPAAVAAFLDLLSAE